MESGTRWSLVRDVVWQGAESDALCAQLGALESAEDAEPLGCARFWYAMDSSAQLSSVCKA